VALIAAIMMQTIGIVWWAATLSARVDVLEERIRAARNNESRIVRLEANQTAVYQRLDRIEALSRRIEIKLDRLLTGRRGEPE
jgi:Tfp pilus assembly protein PilN